MPNFQSNTHVLFGRSSVYFIAAKTAIPIILLHGWPGSFFEFYGVLDLLKSQNYDVVVPSIPGYGYSDSSKQKGLVLLNLRGCTRVVDL